MIEVKCDYCGRPARLVEGKQLYPNRPDLYSKSFYSCKPCNAYVGCHKNSTRPLGRLADAQLRRAKSAAHRAFDPLWQNTEMSREQAYYWLAKEMGIPPEKAHIGMFDVDQCRAVVSLVAARTQEVMA